MRLSKNAVRLGLLSFALYLTAAPFLAGTLAQFATPLNNATSSLAAPHTAGSGTLVLKTGEGSRFGSPTPDAPIRVTVAARSTLVNGQVAATSTQTIFLVTGRTGDTLTGLTATEGTTDKHFLKNDPVASLITAGAIFDVQSAIEVNATALTGKADDDAVVKLTGDQSVTGQKTLTPTTAAGTALVVQGKSGQTGDHLQVKTSTGATTAKIDADGALIQDMTVNATGFASKINPPSGSPPITFNTNVGNFGNIAGGNGFGNAVWQAGWNLGQGGPINPDWPSFRIGMESNYLVPQTGQQVLEGHLFGTTMPGNPTEIRPYSVYIDKPAGTDIQHNSQGNTYRWSTPFQAQQLMYLNRSNATGSVTWQIESDGSTNGFPLQLASVNGANTSDVLRLGRSTSTNTQYTITGKDSTRVDLNAIIAGVTKPVVFINDGSNFSLIGPSNGGGVWNRVYGTFNIANGPSTEVRFSIDANGGTGLGLAGAARNVGLGGTSWANGVGVVAIKDAATVPTTNPTGGGILYSEGGALKWRSPAGTVTTLAPN